MATQKKCTESTKNAIIFITVRAHFPFRGATRDAHTVPRHHMAALPATVPGQIGQVMCLASLVAMWPPADADPDAKPRRPGTALAQPWHRRSRIAKHRGASRSVRGHPAVRALAAATRRTRTPCRGGSRLRQTARLSVIPPRDHSVPGVVTPDTVLSLSSERARAALL